MLGVLYITAAAAPIIRQTIGQIMSIRHAGDTNFTFSMPVVTEKRIAKRVWVA